jgi:hypothetical protein
MIKIRSIGGSRSSDNGGLKVADKVAVAINFSLSARLADCDDSAPLITTGIEPASYFATRSIPTVESAHVTGPFCCGQPLLRWHQILKGKPNDSLCESVAIPFSKPDFSSCKLCLVIFGTQNKSGL